MDTLQGEEAAIFDTLEYELEKARPKFDIADAYYDGAQRLESLGLAIPDELLKFTVIVNWPRIAVDAKHERLDPKGFRLADDDLEAAKDLWRIWQANDMDEQDLMSRLDFLVYGRTFKCVGTNENDKDTPLITVESPREIIARHNKRTRDVEAALRMYVIDTDKTSAKTDTHATLYLPNKTIYLERDGQWQITEVDEHNLGVVPVVPSYRGRRTKVPTHRSMQGTSAIEDIIPLTDSVARNLTNAQVAQETHAVPQRGVIGASKGDFVDASGNPLPVWETYFGAVWAIQNKDAKQFQFDSSDMKNFETMTDLYARLASSVSGLPPNYFGLAADDAASADAIRSREARLVKSCEREQVSLGNGDERTMRIVRRFIDGKWDKKFDGLETLWYDPATPTYASRVDAVTKMHGIRDGAGVSLLPARMAYEELGWSEPKITRAMALRDEERDATFPEFVGAPKVP